MNYALPDEQQDLRRSLRRYFEDKSSELLFGGPAYHRVLLTQRIGI